MAQIQIYGGTFDAETVQTARESVAKWWANNSLAIRQEDHYASHVTAEQKDENLRKGLAFAESIAKGEQDGSFTVAQRIYELLTGKCVALLP